VEEQKTVLREGFARAVIDSIKASLKLTVYHRLQIKV
jgi:hypothetical protein